MCNRCPGFDYYRYLASREWKLLKRTKIAEVGYECEQCHSTEHLQLDHLTYERVGHELLTDLQLLCRECHAFKSGVTDYDPAAMTEPAQLVLMEANKPWTVNILTVWTERRQKLEAKWDAMSETERADLSARADALAQRVALQMEQNKAEQMAWLCQWRYYRRGGGCGCVPMSIPRGPNNYGLRQWLLFRRSCLQAGIWYPKRAEP